MWAVYQKRRWPWTGKGREQEIGGRGRGKRERDEERGQMETSSGTKLTDGAEQRWSLGKKKRETETQEEGATSHMAWAKQ
jgi:hypothetical protein